MFFPYSIYPALDLQCYTEMPMGILISQNHMFSTSVFLRTSYFHPKKYHLNPYPKNRSKMFSWVCIRSSLFVAVSSPPVVAPLVALTDDPDPSRRWLRSPKALGWLKGSALEDAAEVPGTPGNGVVLFMASQPTPPLLKYGLNKALLRETNS